MDIPKGKHIFDFARVGEKGQIVIPKQAREIFNINPGDELLILGDEEQGIAIVKKEELMQWATEIMGGMGR